MNKNVKNSKQPAPKEPLLPKKVIFFVVMLLIPIALFLMIEGILIIFDYGGNLDLFVRSQTVDGDVYVFNPNFSQRYFFKKGIGSAGAHTQPFTVEKTAESFRVFCLGASTTVGTPYPARAAFPAMLQNILSHKFPERKIEVINCGVTAITSFSVLDMAREIVDEYQPDLLVVYSGHNEFYGVFGQGSRLALYDSREMIYLFLKLQRLRLFRLGRDIYSALFEQKIDPGKLIDRETLMGRIASDVDIPVYHPIRKKTESNYRANLTDLADLATDGEVPLIFCTLVSNLRNQPPFKSGLSVRVSDENKEKVEKLIRAAERSAEAGEAETSKNLLIQILEIDSSYADAHYRLATLYDREENYRMALTHYQKASDFDLIRFIAPGSFNRRIRLVAAEKKFPLADVEMTFQDASEGGIIGRNLILEHIHPNSRGYFLIAKTIATTINSNQFIRTVGFSNPTGSPAETSSLSDSAYLSMNHLTPLSEEVVHMAVHRLKSHWPFIQPGEEPPPYQRVGTERTEQLADAYVNKRSKSLVQIHIQLAREKSDAGDKEGAVKEYQAVLAIEPKLEQAISPVIQFYIDQQDFRNARKYLEQAVHYHPENKQLVARLGVICFLLRDFKEATIWLEKAVANAPDDVNLQDMLRQARMITNR